MTLVKDNYVLWGNEPLNRARILWDFMSGTVTAEGTNADFAVNDYTAQRWALVAGQNDWVLTSTASEVDTVFISAHNLSGKLVTVSVAETSGAAYVDKASFTPADNSTIAVMFTDFDGSVLSIEQIRIRVDDGDGCFVGIIRAGKALQMQRPFYGGFNPISLNRITQGQQSISETGQWLGRTEQRVATKATIEWRHLKADWYREEFEPFAQTLPTRPFGIISNPDEMSDDVAWVWTSADPAPSNMALNDLMAVSLDVMGYY